MKDINKVKTPKELLEFMDKNFDYGYLGIDRVHHYDEPDFDELWYDNYVLSNYNDVLRTKTGNCYDMTEFERTWFTNHGYEVRTFYEIVALDYENEYETHAYLVYKDNDKYYYFEYSDFNNRGIYEYDDLGSIIKDNYSKYIDNLKKSNIKPNELDCIKIYEFDKPKEHIDAYLYIKHVTNSHLIYGDN
jgi:hypothetical protein